MGYGNALFEERADFLVFPRRAQGEPQIVEQPGFQIPILHLASDLQRFFRKLGGLLSLSGGVPDIPQLLHRPSLAVPISRCTKHGKSLLKGHQRSRQIRGGELINSFSEQALPLSKLQGGRSRTGPGGEETTEETGSQNAKVFHSDLTSKD